MTKVMERQMERRKYHLMYVKGSSGGGSKLFPKKTQELLLQRMDRGARYRVSSANANKVLVAGEWLLSRVPSHWTSL